MAVNAIFLIWAGFLIWRDRADWFKYVVVGIAFMFLASTPFGRTVTGKVSEGLTWVDGILKDAVNSISF